MNNITNFFYPKHIEQKKEAYSTPSPYLSNTILFFAIAFFSARVADSIRKETAETFKLLRPFLPKALGLAALITLQNVASYGFRSLFPENSPSKERTILETRTSPPPSPSKKEVTMAPRLISPEEYPGNDEQLQKQLSDRFLGAISNSLIDLFGIIQDNTHERFIQKSKSLAHGALRALFIRLENATKDTTQITDFSSALKQRIQKLNIKTTKMDEETFKFIAGNEKLKECELHLNPGFSSLIEATWKPDEIKTCISTYFNEYELDLLINTIDSVFKDPVKGPFLNSCLKALQD